jgi:hypothetical protein
VLEFEIRATRLDAHGSRALCKGDHRLELLHQNVKRYGTVFNTVASGTQLSGTIRRAH